jgi:hypothetical protein
MREYVHTAFRECLCVCVREREEQLLVKSRGCDRHKSTCVAVQYCWCPFVYILVGCSLLVSSEQSIEMNIRLDVHSPIYFPIIARVHGTN